MPRRTLNTTDAGFDRLGRIATEHGREGWHSLCTALGRGELLVIDPKKTATRPRKAGAR